MPNSPEIVIQISALIRGLWFPSETEAPWTIPTWTLRTTEASDIRRSLHRADGVAIHEITLDDLMNQVDKRCQGYGDEGKAIAQQHHTLARYLKHHCQAVRVFRVGNITVDILLVGETPEDTILLQTQSVET
ncbi:MAG: nuclease A inhibitor family protein [Cyanobacteria bacterium J06638_28]